MPSTATVKKPAKRFRFLLPSGEELIVAYQTTDTLSELAKTMRDQGYITGQEIYSQDDTLHERPVVVFASGLIARE